MAFFERGNSEERAEPSMKENEKSGLFYGNNLV
jgi:hypothetical protein